MKLISISSCITRRRHAAHQGFTLVELAIVLGVIGIIAAAIWTFSSQAWENARQGQLKGEIFTVVKNVRTYYQGQNGIQGTFITLTPSLATPNVNGQNPPQIPSDMVRTGGSCTTACPDHPWGSIAAFTAANGSFGVCAWTIGNGNCSANGALSQLFAIELQDMPQSSCINAVLGNAGADAPPGLYDVVVNTQSMSALGTMPPSPATAASNCSSPTGNTIDFIYRLVLPQS